MKRPTLASFDLVLAGATVALLSIGILFIYSSGINANGVQVSVEFIRQIVWCLTGLILLVAPIGVNIFFSPEGLSNMGKTGAGALGMYLI